MLLLLLILTLKNLNPILYNFSTTFLYYQNFFFLLYWFSAGIQMLDQYLNNQQLVYNLNRRFYNYFFSYTLRLILTKFQTFLTHLIISSFVFDQGFSVSQLQFWVKKIRISKLLRYKQLSEEFNCINTTDFSTSSGFMRKI